MKTMIRLLTACLFACLVLPQAASAGGDLGEAPYEIGEKLFARKKYKTALKYYDKALKSDDVRAHYRIGQIHEAAGNDAEAQRDYQRFVDLARPEDAQRADALARIGAIEERRKAEAARTRELLERGRRLFKAGKYREAEKALLQAVSRDASEPEAHFLLGEVYLKLGKYDKASAEYGKAKRAY